MNTFSFNTLARPIPSFNSNSHFCYCNTEDSKHNLVRVDISEGKKHETKVRIFSEDSFTLLQCEDWITKHPSCK